MSRARSRSAAALAVAAGMAAPAWAQIGAAPAASLWSGVFTEAQARRGQAVYTGPCDRCHGYKLDGASDDPDMLPAPPVAGAKFLREWNGRSLAALIEYLAVAMPKNNPGYLSKQELADLIAYMLETSKVPAGDEELPPDLRALAGIVIEPSPR